MKKSGKKQSVPLGLGSSQTPWPAFALAFALLLSPLLIDAKMNRLKLMALGVGFIICGLLWAFNFLRQRHWVFYRTPADGFFVLYFAFAAVFYAQSGNPSTAFGEFERMVFSVGTFALTVQVLSGIVAEKARAWVLRGWLAGLAASAIQGIAQKFGGIGFISAAQMDRVFATFGNPIFFAAFLIVSIPILLGYALDLRRKNFEFFLVCAVLLLSLLALFFTGTRAAFLALPLSLLVFYGLGDWLQNWSWSRSLWQKKKQIVAFVIIFLAAHFLLNLVFAPYQKAARQIKASLFASRIAATAQTHSLIWKDVLRMWQAHPWLGTGYGTFHVEFPQYASPELLKIFPQQDRIINDAHNEFLQILAETGLLGFAVFISLLAAFYWSGLKAVIQLKTGSAPRFVLIGSLCGVTALLIENFFSVDMRFIVSSVYLFLAMGLAASFFARPVEIAVTSKYFKAVWCAGFLALSGMVGLGLKPARFYLVGIYEFSQNADGIWGWSKTPALGPGLFPALVRPYLAQQMVNQTPDFFDEKLLNNAQTIEQLEQLTTQFPQQWKYWEKLGYALAKNMRATAPDGSLVYKKDFVERAIFALSKAHALNPQAEGPSNNLGNIYFTLNERAAAIVWWQKTIEQNPNSLDARTNLGLAYYYEGKIKESVGEFEAVLRLDPRNEKAIVMLKRMVE